MGRGKLRWTERDASPEELATTEPDAESSFPASPDTPERGALDRAVDDLYRAFRGRKASKGSPAICTVCCAPEEVAQRIADAATPRGVSFEDLGQFHSAAKADGAGADMAFLLPRTLECVARGRVPPLAPGLFSLFSYAFAPIWEGASTHERAAVTNYLDALMRWRLTVYVPYKNRRYDGDDYEPLDIVEMAANGGIDIQLPVRVLADPPDTSAAADVLADLVLDRYESWTDVGISIIREPHREAAAEAVRPLLTAPTTLHLLERYALSDDDPELARLASLAHQIVEREAGVEPVWDV